MEKSNKSYVTKEYKDIASDIIYRIKMNGKDVYFYVLLEMQSKVDYTMPFRLLQYMTALLSDIFIDTKKKERERKDFKLPAIIPIVLYNGADNWTAEREYKDYTRDGGTFGDSIINFKYLLFDLNRESMDYISSTKKLLDYMFSYDYNRKKTDVNEIISQIPDIAKNLSGEDLTELVRWMLYSLFDNDMPPKVEEEIIAEIEKGESNMTHALERWARTRDKRIRNEGKKEGLQEGILEGILEGERKGIEFAAQSMRESGMSEDDIKRILKLQ